ncbi:MAG: hypothetical protein C0623_12070 [Desulfuromonas sp.]|nr:MAG: hypothetical protein C0623_12070 [Desulfuromonas sp.]
MNNEIQNKTQRLLDQNDVAEILHISPKTLEYYRYKGMGPRFVKLGKLIRYKENDVFEYIEQLGMEA